MNVTLHTVENTRYSIAFSLFETKIAIFYKYIGIACTMAFTKLGFYLLKEAMRFVFYAFLISIALY